MKGKLKTFRGKDGTPLYPRTHAKGVKFSDGENAEEKVSQLALKQSELDGEVNGKFVRQAVSYEVAEYCLSQASGGGFVSSLNGSVIDSTNWRFSKPIPCVKGRKYIFEAQGNGTNIAMISKTTEEGVTSSKRAEVKVASIDYSPHIYEYVAEEDGYIVVCWNKNIANKLTEEYHSEGLVDSVSRNSQDIIDLKTELPHKIGTNDKFEKSAFITSTLVDKFGNLVTKEEDITTANGAYINGTNGNIGIAAVYAVTDYVNVAEYESITYKGRLNTSNIVALVAFYDEDKTFISSVLGNNEVDKTVPVPDNAKYARFTSAPYNVTNFGIYNVVDYKYADVIKEVAGINKDVKKNAETISTMQLEIIQKLGINDTIKEELNVHTLYDKDGNVISQDSEINPNNGAYIRIADGDKGILAAFAITEYIPVEAENKLYYLGFLNKSSVVALAAFYDEDKMFLSAISDSATLGQEKELPIPEDAKFARFTCAPNQTAIRNFNVRLVSEKSVKVALENVLEIQNIQTALYKEIAEVKKGSLKVRTDLMPFAELMQPISSASLFTPIIGNVAIIGDSLSSGEVGYRSNKDTSIHYVYVYEYSWGQRLCQRMGISGDNYSVGGLAADTWWNKYITNRHRAWNPQGDDKFFDTEKYKTYFLALATNDIARIRTGDLQIGSVADIDMNDFNNNSATYYGNYAKIIQKIKSINAHATIFCIIYPWGVQGNEVDSAIKEIASLFEGVFVLDIRSKTESLGLKDIIKDNYVRFGHYTSIGYQYISHIISDFVNETIVNNHLWFDRLALVNQPIDDGRILWDVES